MDREGALAWAAEARAVRGDVVDGLSNGQTTLDEVLVRAGTEPLVARIKVLTVLEALPGALKVGTRRRLDELGIGHATPLGNLDHDVLVASFGPGR